MQQQHIMPQQQNAMPQQQHAMPQQQNTAGPLIQLPYNQLYTITKETAELQIRLDEVTKKFEHLKKKATLGSEGNAILIPDSPPRLKVRLTIIFCMLALV